jgi:putative SOS response-associated peptidase YedK
LDEQFLQHITRRYDGFKPTNAVAPVCNLYSQTKGQQAIRSLFRVSRDMVGNLPPLPAIFPDGMAPVVRQGTDSERQLEMMRWGMPGPPQYGGALVTNIRNTKSPHWRRWLGPASRCLVPATSFCEYEDTKPRKTPTWFALSDERPSTLSRAYGRFGPEHAGRRRIRLKASTASSAF